MARHKPTAEGGYQRGEETRERLIQSGLKLFGERGFDGASTRDIAAEAGVNAPALQYYFDSKEGLYRACVEHIIARAWEQLEAPIQGMERVMGDASVSDDALIEAFLELLGAMIGLIHDSPQAASWRLFMAREQAGLGPPGTMDMMKQRLHERVRAVTTGVIGRLTGLPAEDERTQIRAFIFNSQGMVFRVLRRQVLSAMGWESIDRTKMEQVREVVLSQTRLTLRGLVAERDEGGSSR